MLNLSFLTFPIIAALVTFGVAVVTDYQTVFIDRVSVPSALVNSTGYNSEVVIERLADEMREIERQARSKVVAREIRMSGDHSAVNVIGDFLSVTPLIRIAQESAGLIPFSFEGDLVSNGRELEVRLRGHDSHHQKLFISERAPLDKFPDLIRSLALEMMSHVDPYLLAAYRFKMDYRQRDFTTTIETIRRQLAKHHGEHDDNTKFLLNLWGIVLYQKGDRAGALEKFDEALHADPDFLSPRLNQGVVMSRQGDNLKAIDQYKEVVARGALQTGNETTVAAALTEWGFSLALLNRTDEAFKKFEEARAVDPTFAELYTSWAEVLSALDRREEAAKMSAVALALAPTEVIYTENLIGPVQTPPAEGVTH